jgi:hypothetical protein
LTFRLMTPPRMVEMESRMEVTLTAKPTCENSVLGFAVNVTSILLSISTILGGVMSLNVNDVLQALNLCPPTRRS